MIEDSAKVNRPKLFLEKDMSSTSPSWFETMKTVITLPLNIAFNHPSTAADFPTFKPTYCPERLKLYERMMAMSKDGSLPVEDAVTVFPTNLLLDKWKVPLTTDASKEIMGDMMAKSRLDGSSVSPEARIAEEMASQLKIANAFAKEGTSHGNAGAALHRAFGAFKGSTVLMSPFANESEFYYNFVKSSH